MAIKTYKWNVTERKEGDGWQWSCDVHVDGKYWQTVCSGPFVSEGLAESELDGFIKAIED